ncbi:MAG TPA: hypothetical protein VHZ03_49090, partial [Trebonia sp.]|nr:hypothetical protein [Trebonia sp.]
MTAHPSDCFSWWHDLLHAQQLQPQVRPPLSCGVACSKSDSLACLEQVGKPHLPSRTVTRWRSR